MQSAELVLGGIRIGRRTSDLDVRRVDVGEVVDQRMAEVEVAAYAWSVRSRSCASRSRLATVNRIRRRLARARGLLLGRGRRRFGLEVVVGALDRGLDELG
jgi:hypothetical protein